ncbi:MAG TPA: hypothetical protein HPP97_07415 [Desulfuromonadales bacterium]|nr:hypothetical protein [Desulfuromonadales bacterium]
MQEFLVEVIQAVNMARLLSAAESEVAEGNTRPVREFFQEFWIKHSTQE